MQFHWFYFLTGRSPTPARGAQSHSRLSRSRLAGQRPWEREAEIASNAGRAPHPDPAAVRLDDSLGDCQPKADPAPPYATRLPEALEDVRKVLLFDARSCVAHAETHFALRSLGRDRDSSAFRRELGGVSDEIRQHLPHAIAIGHHLAAISGPDLEAL